LTFPKPPEDSPAGAIERLKKRWEFLRVAKRGKKWAARGLVLQAWRRSGDVSSAVDGDTVRVGFTVTKKIGRAITRNRVRRRLKAAAGAVLPGECQGGRDLVIIGRAATLARPFDGLVADLRQALRKLDADRPGAGA